MSKTVSMNDLIDAVAAKSGVSKTEAKTQVDGVLATVTEILAGGDKIAIVGFGNFERVNKPERQGRNPSTGEAMTIKASSTVKFSAGKGLKDAVKAA
jgi:DNA-binding protein HU-beta